MILITTRGECAVALKNGRRSICTAGEVIEATPECERFLIERGAAEEVDVEGTLALPEEAEQAAAYSRMTVAELKAALEAKGITPPKGKKEELIELLEKAGKDA